MPGAAHFACLKAVKHKRLLPDGATWCAYRGQKVQGSAGGQNSSAVARARCQGNGSLLLDVRRPARYSSCLGVKDSLQRTVLLKRCRRRSLIIQPDRRVVRLVRHTDAFPNSARLVRVSCLECVFRVQRRRSRATESRQMVPIDRWFLSVCYSKPNSAGVRIAQRTRFCRAPNLITIREAIPPPGISKVAQNSPNPDRLS